ncbi:hypothetical protein GQ54DRAFT_191766 [Martensiomyces pterosporus]|nr:hypothetical protein GQ54DRAFT_191766 [Martensiomyces pterosporus]
MHALAGAAAAPACLLLYGCACVGAAAHPRHDCGGPVAVCCFCCVHTLQYMMSPALVAERRKRMAVQIVACGFKRPPDDGRCVGRSCGAALWSGVRGV